MSTESFSEEISPDPYEVALIARLKADIARHEASGGRWLPSDAKNFERHNKREVPLADDFDVPDTEQPATAKGRKFKAWLRYMCPRLSAEDRAIWAGLRDALTVRQHADQLGVSHGTAWLWREAFKQALATYCGFNYKTGGNPDDEA